MYRNALYCNEEKTEILRKARHESVNQIYFLKRPSESGL